MAPAPVEKRLAKFILREVEVRSPHVNTPCWMWQGGTAKGYGAFTHNGKHLAHRYVYEREVGQIPEGLQLDHLCEVKLCVNPAHLEPVTHGENIRRITDRRGMCVHGHPLNEANTHVRKNGQRQCRVCDREYQRKKYRSRGRSEHDNRMAVQQRKR